MRKQNAVKKILNELRASRRRLIVGKTFSSHSPELEYIRGLDEAIGVVKFHLSVYKYTKE